MNRTQRIERLQRLQEVFNQMVERRRRQLLRERAFLTRISESSDSRMTARSRDVESEDALDSARELIGLE